MTHYETIMLILALITAIFLPMLALMIRLIIRWTNVEQRLAAMAEDFRDFVKKTEGTQKQMLEHGDAVHLDILREMREDRSATNQRLRWLEEHVWKRKTPE